MKLLAFILEKRLSWKLPFLISSNSLVAKNLDIVDACLLSVAAHAKAGELFKNDVGEIGLNASSLIPIIRDLINKWIQYFLKTIQTRAN